MKIPNGQVLAIIAMLLAVTGARADSYTWINTGTSSWTTTTNWSPGSPVGGPGATDDVIWGSGATGAPTTTIANTVNVNSITRNITGAPNWVIGGGATAGVLNVGTINNTLGNVIIRNFSAAGLSVNVTNVNAAGGILYFGAASSSQQNYLNNLTVSGTFSIGGTASVNVNIDNATDNYSLGLLSMASGTIALNQANNGTNKQYVANVTGLTGAGGIIQGYGTSTQGSPTNSGTVAINNSTDFVSGALIRDSSTAGMAGPLSIVKSGSGTQTLTGASTYTGNTTINEGTLKIGNSGTTGSIASNVIMTSTNATFGIDRSNSGTFANTISGSGRLLKQGTGVYYLSGNNTYTGDTVIENGGFQVFSDANLGDASSTIVFNNGSNTASIETAQSTTIARDVIINGTQARFGITGTTNVSTFSGQISGAGGMDKRFVGTLILTNANTYQGGTVITTGTLVAQNTAGSATGTGGVTVNAGRVLAGDGIIAPDAGNNITVAGHINPGLDSTATLTFGLAGASKLDFQTGSFLNFTLGTDSDLVDFATAGDWLTGAGNVTLNLTLGDGFSYDDSYVIFSDVTTAAFTLAGITGYDTGSYLASFEQVGSNYVVSFDAVPEPSTWMLLGLGLTLVLWRSQRRKAAR